MHGCFWHGHVCRKGRGSKSRVGYWGPKLEANQARDRRNVDTLRLLGWESLVIWQCELANLTGLLERITQFLEGPINSIDKTAVTR